MREEARRIYNSRKRRERQLRRRIALSVAALSLLFGIFGFGFLSKAQSEDADVSYKYFTSVQVQEGDSLYSIAQTYADEHYDSVYDYMREVCLTNHLADDKIYTGDYLIIPYYSNELK